MSKKIDFVDTDEKLSELVISKGGLSKSRRDDYNKVFREIYEEFGYTPTELYNQAKKEEVKYLNPETNIVEEIHLNDRLVYKLQLDYYKYLKKQTWKGRKLKDTTIELRLKIYRAFFNKFKIDLPDPIPLDIKYTRFKESLVPSWEDVELAISYCKSPRDQAIVGFAAVTGLRVGDILGLKIKDLIDACEIYFEDGEERTLENLLNKNPDNIVPCWELNPSKTSRFNNLAITFNTPEVTNYIFRYLNWRINLDKKKGGNGVIPTNEALFRRQRNDDGEGHLSVVTVSQHFADINVKLGGEKDKNGVYGKFIIKNLRTLFKSTCKHNLQFIEVNQMKDLYLDVVDLFMGHSDKSSTEYAYDTLPEDSHDSYLRKVYEQLIPYLAIHNAEARVFRSKEYMDLEEQLQQKDNRIEELEYELQQKILETKAQAEQTAREVQELKARKSKDEIKTAIYDYFNENYKKNMSKEAQQSDNEELKSKWMFLPKVAYELALDDRLGFNEDPAYLDSLIKKAKVIISFNPNILYVAEALDKHDDDRVSPIHIQTINDIISIISDNETAWDMVKDNQAQLKNHIHSHLIKSNYVLEELTIDDKRDIAEKVLLDMLNVD